MSRVIFSACLIAVCHTIQLNQEVKISDDIVPNGDFELGLSVYDAIEKAKIQKEKDAAL